MIAVIGIGIFALPESMAMFGGQHNWYDLGADGNQIPCEKCHADVYDDMIGTGPHKNMSCSNCHRTENLSDYVYASGNGTGSVPGQKAHAASSVECMDCHSGSITSFFVGDNLQSHPNIEAGGFNLTVNSFDTGTAASHQAFILGANESGLMEGENEACVACHTHVEMNINWSYSTINMSLNVDGSSGDWVIGNF